MKKKLLSILLSLALVITMMPAMTMTAFADNHVNHAEGCPGHDITFQQWMDSTQLPASSGNYYLTHDVELTETWTVPAGQPDSPAVTNLCLNGFVIKQTGENKSVITVPANATLNLYDCGANGTITGGNANGNTAEGKNGGGVYVSGTFNMYGGSIVGNKAENGGGVSNAGTFTMTGGTITGNTATKGGGVYTTSLLEVNILVGGTITGNTATKGGGVYVKEEECFAAGTPITMADGSRKPIETLKIGDVVRVFDHDTGTISRAKLFDLWKYPEKHSGAVTLHFSHGIDVTVVYGHSFFDREANKYISISRDNVKSYVGHEFYNVDDARWETLIGYDLLDGKVDTYVITSEKHLNCVANGMLTNEDGFYTTVTNIFEYGDGLKINATKKAEDIKKYGLWDFENMKYISQETYDALNLKYMSVAFGKGLITPEAFAYLEAYWCGVDPELLCGTDEKTEKATGKSESFAMPKKMLLTASPAAIPTAPGVYVGGTLQIVENVGGNLYLSSGKAVTLGTGTGEDDNGVAAPTGSFKVGVTTQIEPADGVPVKITTKGTADDTKYFISDNADYMVNFNNNYLELAKIVAYNDTQKIKYASLAEAVFKAVSGDEIELWADENAENVVLPDGVTLYAKSGYTGTVTTNTEGKSVAKQDMFGNYQYKFFVADILMITYKDQGGTTFSGTHESGYPTTFMAEIPLVLKSATKANYPFGGWFDNAECTGNPITGFYAYTYTDNLTLYAKWICNHKSSFTKVKGQAPTESASGWKDYYKCDCGALFEDENGTTPIGNFDTWIAEGGNGYIAKLEEAPLTPEPKKEEYTIPVESEDTVQVEATIENGTAEVKEITKETLEEIVQPSEGKETTTDTIVIDLSQAKQDVTGIVLTSKSVENLKEVLASDKNEIKTVVIQMSEATVEIDAKTLEAVSKEADGNEVRLVVDKTEEKQLNNQQKETLDNYNVDRTFEAYFESNGQRISSFNGGEVVVGIKFTPGEGKNANHYKIYYIDENGKMQKFASKYENGMLKFSTTHFSDYAIVYDDTVEVLLVQGKASGKNAIKLSWNELDNTTKYVVYGNSCGKTSKKLKTVKSNKFTVKKIAGKKLVAHKTYKFYVVGYDAVGNKTTSKTIHFIAANTQGKYANVKSIKAKASTLQLAVGEFGKVGATYKMYSGKKHLGSNHGKALRYISDNPEVVSVSSTGKALARQAGTATIYIQDIGGKYVKTIVTVK